jgi:hypothetical protein
VASPLDEYRLTFSGGHAHGPNGRFGAWTLTLAGASLTIDGDVLGAKKSAKVALTDETLPGVLEAARAALTGSTRMGIPDESYLQIAITTPEGFAEAKPGVWHRDALKVPAVKALLGWIDAVVQRETGVFPAFGN